MVVAAVVAVAVPGGESSSDPVARQCEPLCRYELEVEQQCALQKGCYEQHIISSDALFIQV